MYVIKLNEKELSFLFNNLEAYVEHQVEGHVWYQLMDNLCWDEANQIFKPENPIILNKEQKEEFYTDLVIDSDEILRQLGLDVRYHSMNDTSWGNSKWCLEIISDIMYKIQNAEDIA